ncbi:TonB-dependent receptor [Flavobacterium branchiophilum]|uniref:Outer membrane receptor protein involved in Fe transport n=1 Tax=Flavobacterium branchiophilum TaxID=55197 RepID=A0A543G0Q0_9FLAO|nr:outer membrane beta-barrel family protein [Flavobacterium branchiophilum]OXA79722.1 TonB-dependent receptor [Flavobacterium branchiophilum] [Flavobacterium branchiophilum NBRC 15030 = ATCC 35035]TQM39643.1 outer membrane receptor protein involved in Fe transport [Flavobacterium branchiophilum]GEM56512.1 TonB-dependent receptor [Flavobacterium branchiophilum NBRC 15030 = ATCC 35035]
MKKIQFLCLSIVSLLQIVGYAQGRPAGNKISITGKIVEKTSNQPLEYATVTLINTKNNKMIFGGIANATGDFGVEIFPGIYDIKIEFISFKPIEIKAKELLSATNLGVIKIAENPSQLNEVVVRAEKSTVEIKLDKKVYNVGQDMMVKGGNASDVLGNVPSVTVDSDGNVSLRGNENVRVLIDGRPSNAVNITDALKNIAADAIDKVEVVTNPSARYDAEGGAGILNIILKKGKNNGLNGVITATIGNPKNNGLMGNVNYKSKEFNFFTTIGYNDNKTQGKGLTDSDYFNTDGSYQKSLNERSTRERGRTGYHFNFGMDWYLTKTWTWTNAVTTRKNDGYSPETVHYYNYEINNNYERIRFNDQNTYTNDIEYTTKFTKKFSDEGHKLTLDANFSRNSDNDISIINDKIIGQENTATNDGATNYQTQKRSLLQTDYILPIKKNSQLEAGFKGDYNQMSSIYKVGSYDLFGNYTPNILFTNTFNYHENINAIYTQFGSKIDKISYLLGLRYEKSNIEFSLQNANELTHKQYDNVFPSAFLNYQLTEITSFSINYSKRVARPRGRFIAPYSGYTSNINLFQGNPDINPSFTDALDLGLLTKWKKITLTSSVYINNTKNTMQFIRRPNGLIVDGTAVLVSTPVNLDKEMRYGLEFNINYNPFKWWKLNGNFNLYESQIKGNFSYNLLSNNELVTTQVDKNAGSWFARISSRITLPYKIDFQANGNYMAPQNTAQGKSLAMYMVNLAFSKDILKDKATLSLNVSDLFNTAKMYRQFNLPTLNSYSEMQRRVRQINLTFSYRFNKKKTEREKPAKSEEMGGGDF